MESNRSLVETRPITERYKWAFLFFLVFIACVSYLVYRLFIRDKDESPVPNPNPDPTPPPVDPPKGDQESENEENEDSSNVPIIFTSIASVFSFLAAFYFWYSSRGKQTQLDQLQNDYDRQLSEALEPFNNDLKNLENQLAGVQNEKTQLALEIEELNSQIDGLKSENPNTNNAESQTELENISSQTDDLNTQIQVLQTQNEELQKNIATNKNLETQLKETQTREGELKNANSLAFIRNSDLKKQNEQLKKTIVKNKKSIEILTARKEDLEKKFDDKVKEKADKFEKELKESKSVNLVLRTAITTLEESNLELKDRITEFELFAEKIQLWADQNQIKKGDLLTIWDSKIGELKEKSTTIKELEKQKTNLEKQVNEKDAKISNLQENINQIQTNAEKTKEKYEIEKQEQYKKLEEAVQLGEKLKNEKSELETERDGLKSVNIDLTRELSELKNKDRKSLKRKSIEQGGRRSNPSRWG